MRRRELLDEEQIEAPIERTRGRRHHADQRVVGAVEPDRLADRVGAAAEPLLPERVAGNRHRRRAGLAVLLR